MRRALWIVTLSLLAPCCAGADVPVVSDGRPVATVVIPADALPVVRYAADELVFHVKRASDATLPIVTDDQAPAGPQIRLGPVPQVELPRFDPTLLNPDACLLRTVGQTLYVYGRDSGGPPLGMETGAGTLMGVYELLATELGVRWLWPGDLGVVVPAAKTIVLPDMDRIWTPQLIKRQVRFGNMARGDVSRGFTEDGRKAYLHAENVFLRRHRLGSPIPLRYGHAFEQYWAKYGQEHPEWFQLLENGKRGPAAAGRRYSMCVSDPGFINQVVDEWRERKAADGIANLNGCENDIHGLCTCERCMSWDGPQPANLPARFGPRMVSDRYARFWLTAQQLAAEEDPAAVILGYAYVNYAHPPTSGIQLNNRIWVGTVPDLFFPRQPDEQQWVKDQWAGWAKTGCQLFLRPNYFLDGYCMPQIFARQFGDEFVFEAERGMIFTDFDSLTGQWSTQGPNLYLLMRLQAEPTGDIAAMLDEYYAGFGAAGPAVRAYFDFWEHHTMTHLLSQKSAQTWNWSNYALAAPAYFPTAALDEGARLLNAAAAAANDDVARSRVQYLQNGLRHARMACEVTALLQGQGDVYRPTRVHQLVAELVDFRRQHEADCLSNFDFCSFVESRSWQLPDGYTGEPLRAVAPRPAPLVGEPVIPLRGQGTFVASLAAGEPFRAKVVAKKVGDRTEPVSWSLYAPDGRKAADGEVALNTTGEITGPAGAAGGWVLLLDTRLSAGLVTLLNDHAVFAVRTAKLIYAGGPLYFEVPAGTTRLTMKLRTSAPAETAVFTVRDASGQAVWTGETTTIAELLPEIAVPVDAAGEVWSIDWSAAATGVLEDVQIELGPELPPYLSLAADRLLVPAAGGR